MTRNTRRGGPPHEPIGFGQRFAESPTFKALFREGMAMVEETAAYLDGDGRVAAKALGRAGSLAYATESMRLTTRLMQLASWLLLQRAVNEGEMTPEQARQEKAKVRLRGFDTGTEGPGWANLPPELRGLIERSQRLQVRIRLLDASIYDGSQAPEAAPPNPVAQQIGALSAALGARAAES